MSILFAFVLIAIGFAWCGAFAVLLWEDAC